MSGALARTVAPHIPNALSLTRIVLAFCFPFIVPEYRLPVIGVAVLTEFFDGFLARRMNAVSRLGQALDPIADKLFVIAAVVVLLMDRKITFFQLTLVAMRDIVVSVGSVSVLLHGGKESLRQLLPRISGKVTTALQFLLLLILFLDVGFPRMLLSVTAFVSCVSAIDYLYAGFRAEFTHERRI